MKRRKDRVATGLTLLEGPHLLEAAVGAGASIEQVFALPDTAVPAGLDVTWVTDEVLARLAPTENPRGPVAVLRPEPRELGAQHALVLWGIADPGNAGTLVRTAAAFSLDVIATPETTDLWAPKVLRAGAGAHFSVGFGEAATLTDLEQLGYRTAAAVGTGGAWPDEVQTKSSTALLVGNEAHGLPPEVVAAAGVRVSIPMPGGTESFNAGVAGSILAYALFSQGDE